MAFYVIPQTASAGRFSHLVRMLLSEFNVWRERLATRKALSGLSDHELDDIGLMRADLDTATGESERAI